MRKVIVVTEAANGIGKSACGKLAQAGHTVYASMRETKGRNAHRIDEFQAHSDKDGVDLRVVELDVSSETSVNSAIESIIAENGRLDVVVHNVGQIAARRHLQYVPLHIVLAECRPCQRHRRALALGHDRRRRHHAAAWVVA
jgi:NAD(P)-dependent dehydrogenase (short-subunit alcohol dehydrogenase family)